MFTSIKDTPKWVQPDDDAAIDTLPFSNNTMSAYLLTKFKDADFDIESFISENVCQFADQHK